MAEDPNASSSDSGTTFDSSLLSNFLASGNVAEMKSQLMQYKFIHDMFKRQGSPLVINAEQFRGTIKLTDKPKVTLYFLQKPEDVRGGYTQIPAEASFRLVDKPSDPELWSDDMYQTLAQRIQDKLASPIFSFKHGKEIVSYVEPLKGYQLQIWSFDKTEGHRVIEQILDIQGHSVELEFESHKVNSSPSKKYPDTPEKKVIRGKTRRRRRRGVVGTVWFRHAFLTFPAFNDVIWLVDTTSSKPNPVLLQSPQILDYNVGKRAYNKTV
jgi:hypothetical protein